MSENKPHEQPAERHETRDINVVKVALFTVALLAVITLGGLLIPLAVLKYDSAGKATSSSGSLRQPAQELPPEPRLQTREFQDLLQMRAAEEQRLHSYGWVDRTNGVVRIPIERAIELVAQRGLPARPDLPLRKEAK